MYLPYRMIFLSGLSERYRQHSALVVGRYLDEFDLGDSMPAAIRKPSRKNAAENITMVLYPNDASENGKELRLRQQYFLAAARHNRYGGSAESLRQFAGTAMVRIPRLSG